MEHYHHFVTPFHEKYTDYLASNPFKQVRNPQKIQLYFPKAKVVTICSEFTLPSLKPILYNYLDCILCCSYPRCGIVCSFFFTIGRVCGYLSHSILIQAAIYKAIKYTECLCLYMYVCWIVCVFFLFTFNMNPSSKLFDFIVSFKNTQ